MRKHPDETVQINGHTDSDGSNEHNLSLSDLRAQAAFAYLVGSQGLPPDQFTVTGFGEDKPVASNGTETGRQLNRRVEIKGELTEIERTAMYSTPTSETEAAMNGVAMTLGNKGQFTSLLDAADSNTVIVQMKDEVGRGIDTMIAMPNIQLFAQSSSELIPFAPDDPRRADPASETADEAFAYRFIGQTDVGNVVRIDDEIVELDATGRLEIPNKVSAWKQIITTALSLYSMRKRTYRGSTISAG